MYLSKLTRVNKMENMTKESKLSFTSNPTNSDSYEGFYSRCVVVKEEQGMTELERKFIMMSRIAVQLVRKGLIAGATHYGDFCAINVQCSESFNVLEDVNSDHVQFGPIT